MNWYKVFYLLSIADKVSGVMLALVIVTGIYTIVASVWALGLGDNPWKDWGTGAKRVYYIWTTTFFLSLILFTFLPSKKDCILIIAGGSVGNFITTDSSSLAIPADITKYLHVALNREISDLDTEFKKDMGMLTKKEEFIEKVKSLSKEEVI